MTENFRKLNEDELDCVTGGIGGGRLFFGVPENTEPGVKKATLGDQLAEWIVEKTMKNRINKRSRG